MSIDRAAAPGKPIAIPHEVRDFPRRSQERQAHFLYAARRETQIAGPERGLFDRPASGWAGGGALAPAGGVLRGGAYALACPPGLNALRAVTRSQPYPTCDSMSLWVAGPTMPSTS